jgi:hypothetical protein
MALFTTALNLYGGALWSGELQGFIIRERVPTPAPPAPAPGPRVLCAVCWAMGEESCSSSLLAARCWLLAAGCWLLALLAELAAGAGAPREERERAGAAGERGQERRAAGGGGARDSAE